ncbi:MAG: sorbosone dehydrogenase family protein [Phycisphaerales bacterium]
MRPAHALAALTLLAAPALARPLAALSVTPITPATLTNPITCVQHPTDPNTFFIAEKAGRVRTVTNGVILPQDLINLTSIVKSNTLEEGLLGMAFSPNFASDRRVFFNFTSNTVVPSGQQTPPSGATIVARFTIPSPAIPGDPLIADFNTRFDLDFNFDLAAPGQRWIQQFSNHKGGNLAFSPDGYLFMGMGDGGGQNDPSNRGQTPTTLLGKILRIDVNVPDTDPVGFAIPPSNPFLAPNNPPTLDPFYAAPLARPHIWAFGVRNPWRWSFDSLKPTGFPHTAVTNDFFLADVGQNAWEEINRTPHTQGAVNFGWRHREGAHNFNTSLPAAYLPFTDPIAEYSHSVGLSITGGFVYRGKSMCSFQGRYFYADYQNGRIWSMKLDGTDNREHTNEIFGATRYLLVSFCQARDGELYLVRFGASGQLLKLTSTDVPLLGDINGDRTVNFADINLILSNYSAPYTFANLNNTLSEYGASCTD